MKAVIVRQQMNWHVANLQDGNKGKGFQGICYTCDKQGYKSVDCKAPKKEKGDKKKFNTQGGGNKKYCDHCGHDGHTEAECFRKPENPGYKEFKPKGGNIKASNFVQPDPEVNRVAFPHVSSWLCTV